jgi:hypothetical protein
MINKVCMQTLRHLGEQPIECLLHDGFANIHTYIHIYIHTYILTTYIHTYTHTHTHACIHTYTHTCIINKVCMQTLRHLGEQPIECLLHDGFANIHTYIHTYMYNKKYACRR